MLGKKRSEQKAGIRNHRQEIGQQPALPHRRRVRHVQVGLLDHPPKVTFDYPPSSERRRSVQVGLLDHPPQVHFHGLSWRTRIGSFGLFEGSPQVRFYGHGSVIKHRQKGPFKHAHAQMQGARVQMRSQKHKTIGSRKGLKMRLGTNGIINRCNPMSCQRG